MISPRKEGRLPGAPVSVTWDLAGGRGGGSTSGAGRLEGMAQGPRHVLAEALRTWVPGRGPPCPQPALPSPSTSTCMSEPCGLEGEPSVTFPASEPTHTSSGKEAVMADPAGCEKCRLTAAGPTVPRPPGKALGFVLL